MKWTHLYNTGHKYPQMCFIVKWPLFSKRCKIYTELDEIEFPLKKQITKIK